MAHVLAIKFRSLLTKKSKPPKDEPIIASKANEVFHIYELVENILSYLPALDLLVVQMVNPTCNRVVSTTPSFQAKLFMTPGPLSSGGVDKEIAEFGANEPRWNPFLMHYGTPIPEESGFLNLRIKREYLWKFDRPDASWKKMFLAQPTNQDFSAHLVSRTKAGEHICFYRSSDKNSHEDLVRMEVLMELDTNRYRISRRSMDTEICLKVWSLKVWG